MAFSVKLPNKLSETEHAMKWDFPIISANDTLEPSLQLYPAEIHTITLGSRETVTAKDRTQPCVHQ